MKWINNWFYAPSSYDWQEVTKIGWVQGTNTAKTELTSHTDEAAYNATKIGDMISMVEDNMEFLVWERLSASKVSNNNKPGMKN